MRQSTLTMSAAVLSLFALAAPAHAQFDGWMRDNRPAYDDQDYRRSYYDARRVAYDNGYREGLRHGEEAARDRRPFDLQREKDYRKADEGYNRSYGDKDRYRETFRSGFAAGYREAYDRYAPRYGYGNNFPRNDRGWGYPGTYGDDRHPDYRGHGGSGGPGGYGGYGSYGSAAHIAYQNGMNDGYEKGVDDAHDRKAPDARRQKWYRSGDRHYEDRYGSKEAYKDEYRAGFEEGYRHGYNDARRY